MAYRVLVVEDYEPFRQFLSSTLQNNPQWQVVGETSDGIEAVQKAHELKPDLILLDVGLPTLNGIEAARRILAHDHGSRVLFVSEHRSWDIAEAALGTGARGYIVKSDAGRELLPAMERIVEGGRFVSPRLGGRVVETASGDRVTQDTRSHEVEFFSDQPSLLDGYAAFAEAALGAGKSLIVMASDSRRDQLHRRLQERGVDIGRAIEEHRYFPLDVAAALSRCMTDGSIDEARFWSDATALILSAAHASQGEHPRVAACGECSPTLLRHGMTEAAIRLEQLWDEVCRTYAVDIFCAYSAETLPHHDRRRVLHDICSVHSAVRDNSGLLGEG